MTFCLLVRWPTQHEHTPSDAEKHAHTIYFFLLPYMHTHTNKQHHRTQTLKNINERTQDNANKHTHARIRTNDHAHK